MSRIFMLFLSLSLVSSNDQNICSTKGKFSPQAQHYEFTLPDLPYSHNYLQPQISMSIVYAHHDHHHQKYVDKLNSFLEDNPDLQDKTLVQLVEMAASQVTLQKQAGGFYNHLLYWWVLSNDICVADGPDGGLLKQIEKNFGSFDEFKTQFTDASNGAFGSAWTWACVNMKGDIEIRVYQDQINPLMGIDSSVCYPFFAEDLWEHAYYLQYLWERGIYIDNYWSIVDWKVVEDFYDEYASKKIAIPFA